MFVSYILPWRYINKTRDWIEWTITQIGDCIRERYRTKFLRYSYRSSTLMTFKTVKYHNCWSKRFRDSNQELSRQVGAKNAGYVYNTIAYCLTTSIEPSDRSTSYNWVNHHMLPEGHWQHEWCSLQSKRKTIHHIWLEKLWEEYKDLISNPLWTSFVDTKRFATNTGITSHCNTSERYQVNNF